MTPVTKSMKSIKLYVNVILIGNHVCLYNTQGLIEVRINMVA